MERTCTCKAWQMSGIPCDHTCATIRQMGFDVSDYVDDWYKYNLQEKIYSGSMHTLVMHDMPMIDEDGTVCDALGHTYPFLNPPTTKQPLGKPRKRRIKSQFMSKKWFIALIVISMGIIVRHVTIHCCKFFFY